MSESWRAKTWVSCHPHIWLIGSELSPFHPRWPHRQMKRGDFPTFYMVLGVGEFSFCAGPFRPLASAWISLKTISDVILNLWNLKHAFKILWNKDVPYQTQNAVGIDKVTFLQERNDSFHSLQTVLTEASQNKLSSIGSLWCLTLKKNHFSKIHFNPFWVFIYFFCAD